MITRRNFLKVTAAGGALVSFGQISDAKQTVKTVIPNSLFAQEERRSIPIIADADIVVVGATSAAVEAAADAARCGSSVFLVAPLSYLGDDICGSFLYDLHKGEKPLTALCRKIYTKMKTPTPLYVKTVLEDELIENGVGFLYSSYVTNVLSDDSGHPAGVVIANRSGRQAIRCRAIIDATHTAMVAGLAGASFSSFVPGEKNFFYTVVGNTHKESPEIIDSEILPYTVSVGERKLPVTRYTFKFPLMENTYGALQNIEQIIRDKTWDADQGDSSDLLSYIPFCSVLTESSYTEKFTSVRNIPESVFIPKNIDNIWILGPAAGVNMNIAEHLMRPVNSMLLGEIIGERVSKFVSKHSIPDIVTVKSQYKTESYNYGSIGELLQPLRKNLLKGNALSSDSSLPVLGVYDVIVMGGGTAGAPAGISAARKGAKTLVLEYLHGLGGLMTLGLIGRYWDGFRGGFTEEVDAGVRSMAPLDHPRQHKDWTEAHNSDWKQEWFRRELRKSGADIWFGVMGCGAVVDNHVVKGVVITTPFGRGVVLSKVVIDSTGSADIAIAAGAEYEYSGKNVATQGAGLSQMHPWDYYNNNDWAFIDDTDILDVSRIYVQAKTKQAGKYDIVKLPQTRERRRIVGDYTISVYDVLNHRRYPDTISYHKSSFDTHGMIIDPYFILCPPEKRHMIYDADVPIRSLLPKGFEGIIVTGLGVSAHRDAMPVIRMQSCLQSQGFAVGYFAAVSVDENKTLRKVDMKKIQRFLIKKGNLPERVLSDKRFNGYSDKEMKLAADTVADNYKGLEILLTDHSRCLSLINAKMSASASFEDKIIYASILCMLGDKKYVSVLSDKIREYDEWDEGWHYTGMGQFGSCLSRLDALIMALGNAKDASTLPIIIEKARMLSPEDCFSHFRAVTMAMETIGDKGAIPVLADMLTMPGIRFHYIDSYLDARRKVVPDSNDVSTRNIALKELHIARALFICGDKDELGKNTLQHYASGLQGHYSKYAEDAKK